MAGRAHKLKFERDVALARCLLIYGTNIQASIGQTPSFMTTGQGMRLPSDTTLPISAPEALYSSVFVRRMQAGLVRSHELARQRLRAAQRCQKGYYDKAAQDMLFNLGDWVWLYEPVPPTGTPAKFHGAWKGPYTIDQAVTDVTYRLIHPGKSNWSTAVNVNRLLSAQLISDSAVDSACCERACVMCRQMSNCAPSLITISFVYFQKRRW
ncbi:hypothetical protein T265_06898 [Opisthorchis viverrini]|uniref:Uncharacterized protein n=1 Tax=Opisthorchis viverrini TaxID=6198 RepID=A0A074ZEX2_OPIVI|nr:hypothetical protein T265_06898 [Opisthorchis viverrini]KER25728.1 hypothetical protein T265_06898 [Opisthorchis viverrini]